MGTIISKVKGENLILSLQMITNGQICFRKVFIITYIAQKGCLGGICGNAQKKMYRLVKAETSRSAFSSHPVLGLQDAGIVAFK